jgi:hypothetical protein
VSRPKGQVQYRQVPVGRVLSFLQAAEPTARVGYIVVYTLGPTSAVQFWSARRSRRLGRRDQERLFAASQVLGWLCWYNPRLAAWYYEFDVSLAQ